MGDFVKNSLFKKTNLINNKLRLLNVYELGELGLRELVFERQKDGQI